jgi:polygalacturonase
MKRASLLHVAAAALGAATVAMADPLTANVLFYGADPTGMVESTTATIAALMAIDAGGQGGVLLFPLGTYLMTPFNVTVSNVEVRLQQATLIASSSYDDWPIIAPLPSYGRGRDFPGPRYSALISFWNVSNVRLRSVGGTNSVLDGQGDAWWPAVKNGSLTVTPGHMIEVLWSENVEVDHVTMINSPFWFTHLWSSRNLHVHDVVITAPTHSTNTDGIDPDACDGVVIERVTINNGDGACGWHCCSCYFCCSKRTCFLTSGARTGNVFQSLPLAPASLP